MVKGIEAVAVGLVVFILAQKLIATLITGTDTGSVIIQTLVALLIAFGVVFLNKKLGTSESNLRSKQRKFGGTLNQTTVWQANAEPSRESSDFRACVETRNVRPTVSNRGRWHSPLSCESMSLTNRGVTHLPFRRSEKIMTSG